MFFFQNQSFVEKFNWLSKQEKIPEVKNRSVDNILTSMLFVKCGSHDYEIKFLIDNETILKIFQLPILGLFCDFLLSIVK